MRKNCSHIMEKRGEPMSLKETAGKFRKSQIFTRALEIVTVAATYVNGSRIGMFLKSKVEYTIVGEVYLRFGRDTGQRVSTYLAMFDTALQKDPWILAAGLAGILFIVHGAAFLGKQVRRRHRSVRERRKRQQRLAEYFQRG